MPFAVESGAKLNVRAITTVAFRTFFRRQKSLPAEKGAIVENPRQRSTHDLSFPDRAAFEGMPFAVESGAKLDVGAIPIAAFRTFSRRQKSMPAEKGAIV